MFVVIILQVLHESVVGTEGSLALGVFWPAPIYKQLTGLILDAKACMSYTHGKTVCKGIIRDDQYGNPTGTIKLVSKTNQSIKRLDTIADSRDCIRGIDQVTQPSGTRTFLG